MKTTLDVTVLIASNTLLRRHRRKVLWVAAIVAAVGLAVTARTALMSAHSHDGLSDAAAICFTAGACVAVVVGTVLLARRPASRPSWQLPDLAVAGLPFARVSTGFLARAGPPPLLQVFRL